MVENLRAHIAMTATLFGPQPFCGISLCTCEPPLHHGPLKHIIGGGLNAEVLLLREGKLTLHTPSQLVALLTDYRMLAVWIASALNGLV